MGRKLDLSALTDDEAEHVLQVVQRDMRLRNEEEKRLSEMRQELDEEGVLLSQRSCFNQRCCIHCCAPFTFLLNPKRCCLDCHYNVCRACCAYSKRDRVWLCSACQKNRLLKTQSLEWFYTNVKSRFKRFGSAKVLKNLYKKHSAKLGALSDLTEGSAYEESLCNDGSICGSDSAFYRQSEDHSTALTVALKVAEEALDEAISKVEFDTDNQEKQNEAHYLREHRGELIEELAKTIVQKIINRRKSLAEMKQEYEQNCPSDHNTDLQHYRAACTAAYTSLKLQPGLWKSCSALSLLDVDPPELNSGVSQALPQGLKKEDATSAMSALLDNSSGPSMLKSPDGNWIALQSAQLSRPSLLTKRKSLVYSALERESSVVSAYEGMGSDTEAKPEPDNAWGAALREIQRRMVDTNCNLSDRPQSPSPGTGGSDVLLSDSDSHVGRSHQRRRSVFRKIASQKTRSSSSRRTSIADVNFNPEGLGEETSSVGKVGRSQKKKRSNKEKYSDAVTPTLSSGSATDLLDNDDVTSGVKQLDQDLTFKLQQLATHAKISHTSATGGDFVKGRDNEGQQKDETDAEGGTERDQEGGERSGKKGDDKAEKERTGDEVEDIDEVKYSMRRLVALSRITWYSSSDNEEDPERQVKANRFSSTEEELDRDSQGYGEEEDDGKRKELAAKLCRLGDHFSSTEDELDRVGGWGAGERKQQGATRKEALWKMEARKTAQAAPVRHHRASLLSACELSSTEDELYRVDEDREETENELDAGEEEVDQRARAEAGDASTGDLDVLMFTFAENGLLEIKTRAGGSLEEDARTGSPGDVPLSERREDGERPEKTAEDTDGPRDHMVGRKSREPREEEEVLTEVLPDRGKETDEGEVIADNTDMGGRREAVYSNDDDDDDKELHKIGSSMRTPYGLQADKDSFPETGGREEEVKVGQTVGCEEMKSGVEKADGHRKVSEGKGASEHVEGEREREGLEGLEEDITGNRKGKGFGPLESDVTTWVHRRRETGKKEKKTTSLNLENTPDKTANERKHKLDEDERKNPKKIEGQERSAENSSAQAAEGFMERKGDKLGENKEDECDTIETKYLKQMTSSHHEGILSPEEIHSDRVVELEKTIQFISALLTQRYSAASLCNITTEVLKVLNATEELLQGAETGDSGSLHSAASLLPPNADPRKLDQQFSRLEENVYIAAGTAYNLEEELGDLEECARSINTATSDLELSFLEEKVASAAVQVQQSELQVSDISARISALRSAGLKVDPKARFSQSKVIPVMPITLDSSRQIRRRLPAPPKKW